MNNIPYNPLIHAIAGLLDGEGRMFSEYELLQALDVATLMPESSPDCSPDMCLYRRHFLLMNALYQLQDLWSLEGRWLQVSALEIGCRSLSPTLGSLPQADTADAALRSFYLDFSNLEGMDETALQELLGRFWQRLYAGSGREDALAVLGLAPDASEMEIKDRYRRLVRDAHPDRGGDAAKFLRIREAYEVLIRHQAVE